MLPIDDLPADCAFIGNAQMVGGSSRKVVLLSVYAHRAVGREARCQACHAFPHPLDPCRGNAALVSGIKLRDHLPFEQVVERVGFDRIPSGTVAMLPAIPQRPPTAGDLELLSRESIDVVVAMRNAQLRACAHCNLHVRMLLLRQMQEVFNSIEHRAYELFESRGSQDDLHRTRMPTHRSW